MFYFILLLSIALFLVLLNIKAGKFPYTPGQEPTLPGHVDFLLQVCI